MEFTTFALVVAVPLTAAAAIGALYKILRAPQRLDVMWVVVLFSPCCLLLALDALLVSNLTTPFGLLLAYASFVAAALTILAACKCVMLSTRGVVNIPDGLPNDPDIILSQLPAPLKVHPVGELWRPAWSMGLVLSPIGPAPDPAPRVADHPNLKQGEWQEDSGGKSIRMRWAPVRMREGLGQHFLPYLRWVVFGPAIFALGIDSFVFAPGPRGFAMGLFGAYVSLNSLRLLASRSTALSRLVVDAPLVVARGSVRNPARTSAFVEAFVLLLGFSLSGGCLLYAANQSMMERTSVAVAAVAFYASLSGTTICLCLAWRSIRPLPRIRMVAKAVPQAVGPSEAQLRVAHWSDLHLTRGEDVKRLDGLPSPNAAWARVIDECLSRPLPDLLLLTGDITNAGDAGEWTAFNESLKRLPAEALDRMIVIPGNHDLNISHPSELAASDDVSRLMRQVRMVRMIDAIERIQGSRSWVVSDHRLVRVSDLVQTFRSELARFVDEPPQRRERFEIRHIPLVGVSGTWIDATPKSEERRLNLPFELWHDMFPMVIEEPSTKVLVYVLDTNYVGGHIVDNAFGHVHWDQLVRFRLLRRHFGARPSIVLIHHHVALPPATLKFVRKLPKDALFRRFMLLDNVSELMAALPRPGRCLLFHGHRHVGFVGELDGRMAVVSAPSTTIGDEGEQPRHEGIGYSVFGLEISGENVSVKDEEWVSC